MVATQVLISLCVAGLTVAAPQLDLPGVQRTVTTVAVADDVNEEALVNNVVTALEPSIALAVANALRSLQTTSTTTTISEGALIGGGASSGVSSSPSSSSSSSAAKSSSSTSKSSFSASAAAEKAAFEREFAANEEPTTRPEYNFEFKVADADEQTYITQQEARDGDELTGSYSYVNPEGALITVNYQAGPMGYTETRDVQEGFIQIVPKPPRIAAANSAASSSGVKVSGASSSASKATGGAASFSSQQTASTASSALDESALIAQILAALQPQISASVNAALTASQSRTASTSSVIAVPAAVVPATVAVAPVAVAARPLAAAARPVAAASSGNLASLFGDGYAVRIATPEFKIEY